MTTEMKIQKMSEIELQEVEWLWYPYIPYGKLTMIQGDPGGGKTMLILHLAGLLSSAHPLPFDDENVERRSYVAADKYVRGVANANTINYEVVVVQL